MAHPIDRFLRESGFKLLAISDLSAPEYSVVLYLLNSAMSGLENLITTEADLAASIGLHTKDIRAAIESLEGRSLIKSRYGDGSQVPKLQSLSIAMNWDLSRWKLGIKGPQTHHEAMILPFRRTGVPKLSVLEGKRHDSYAEFENPLFRHQDDDTTQRILDIFSQGRILDEHEKKINRNVAATLGSAHPVDQILLMIRHFDKRIPTLSLLASNWEQYLEQYENEHQKLDLFGQRQKQSELDQKVRDSANLLLDKSTTLDLSDDEINVLELLANHRHPRRQLFWAYQMRIRYPKLNSFFADTHNLMLPITQNGTVVKMPSET